jgi:polygalacturonase
MNPPPLRRSLPLVAMLALAAGCATDPSATSRAVPRNIERLAAMRPELPRIPDRQVSVRDFGTVGDGLADDTAAIQRAIDAASAAGGGKVVVPAGRYLIGPIRLASRIELHLELHATLLGSDDIANYPKAPSRYYKDEVRHVELISADFCTDVAITGPGTIDGQGRAWWREFYKHKRPEGHQPWENASPTFPRRPNLVVLSGCQRVLISGVMLTNSPMFHLVPQQCYDLTIDGIKILAPTGAPNTDGIDPSGRRIRIVNCDVRVGDDNLVFKPQYPPTYPRPADAAEHYACEDLYVADCTFGRGHGLSIGGQTTDGLRRLLAERCTFEGTKVGVRFKAEQGTGGPVEDCVYRDLTLNKVGTALLVTPYYPSIPRDPATMPAKRRDEKTPRYERLRFERVRATGSTEAGSIIGLAEVPVDGVTFRDVTIDAKRPMRINDALNVRFERTTVTPGVVATRSQITGIDVGAWTGEVAPIGKDGAPATTKATTQPTTSTAQ